MKKVLVSIDGRAMQIVDPGQEFEVYNGPDAKFVWVDVDNDNSYSQNYYSQPSNQNSSNNYAVGR